MLRNIIPSIASKSGGTTITIHGNDFDSVTPYVVIFHTVYPPKDDGSKNRLIKARASFVRQTQLEIPSSPVFNDLKHSLNNVTVQVVNQLTKTPLKNVVNLIVHSPIQISSITPEYSPTTSPKDRPLILSIQLNNKEQQRQHHQYAVTNSCKDKGTTSVSYSVLTSMPVWVRVSNQVGKNKKEMVREYAAKWNEVNEDEIDQGLKLELVLPTQLLSGTYSATVSLNRQEFSTSSIKFHKYQNGSLKRIHPFCIPYSKSRKYEFSIYGDNFSDTKQIVVQVKSNDLIAYYPGTFVSKSCVTTIIQNIQPGTTVCTVSCNNGQDYVSGIVDVFMYYVRTITKINPPHVSDTGGLPLEITLDKEMLREGKSCGSFNALSSLSKPPKFVVQFMLGNSTVLTSPATLNGNSIIVCKSPAMTVAATQDKAAVSVLLENVPLQGTLPFNFYKLPMVQQLSIQHGPSCGGTRLEIQLENAVPKALDDESGTQCTVRFLLIDRHLSVVTEGVVVHDDDGDPEHTIACITPEWSLFEPSELVNISVSYNGIEFFEYESNPHDILIRDWSFAQFLFYTPPVVTEIAPKLVDNRIGHLLWLAGDNIVDYGAPISVVFQFKDFAVKVPGAISEGKLRCCTPPGITGLAKVFLSLNSQQYSMSCKVSPSVAIEPLVLPICEEPILSAISPECIYVFGKNRTLTLLGSNFVNADKISVRFFSRRQSRKKRVSVVVEGKYVVQGTISCEIPKNLASLENLNSSSGSFINVDVSFNGRDYSDSVPLWCFYENQVISANPNVGACELPLRLTLQLKEEIHTSNVLVRALVLRDDLTEYRCSGSAAISWSTNSVEWECPALSNVANYISNGGDPHKVCVQVAFDSQNFIDLGNLMQCVEFYHIPRVERLWPVGATPGTETKVEIFGVGFDCSIPVTVQLRMRGYAEKQNIECDFVSKEQLTCVVPAQLPGNISQSTRVFDFYVSTHENQFAKTSRTFTVFAEPVVEDILPHAGLSTGGALIKFIGRFFSRLPEEAYLVRFSNANTTMATTVVGTRMSDNRIECTSPEIPEGHYTLTIAYNQQHFLPVHVGNEPGTYQSFLQPSLSCPTTGPHVIGFGPVTGGTPVRIFGEGFVSTGLTTVLFEGSSHNDSVPAKAVEANFIECTSPPFHLPGKVCLRISCNDQQFSTESFCYFDYHMPVEAGVLLPSCGPVTGQSILTLPLKNLDRLLSYPELVHFKAQFRDADGMHEEVTIVSVASKFEEITIQTPLWCNASTVELWISVNNGIQYVDSHREFTYFGYKSVSSFSPVAGPVTGGTVLSIKYDGEVFESAEVVVRFTIENHHNATVLKVPGKVVRNTITCETPVMESKVVVLIHVSLNNGVDYLELSPKTAPLRFHYYNLPEVTSFMPLCGSIAGNVKLRIRGNNFLDMNCPILVRFFAEEKKQISVPGTVEGREVVCVTPRAAVAGKFFIEVALNGQQFSTSGYAKLSRALQPFVVFVPPFYVMNSAGPCTGGATVTICGDSNLSQALVAAASMCQVKFTPIKQLVSNDTLRLMHHATSESVPASTVDIEHTIITCRSPRFEFPCTLAVHLVIGDPDSVMPTILSSNQHYKLYENPIIESISPNSGPFDGSPFLTFEGQNIYKGGSILIKFTVKGRESHFPDTFVIMKGECESRSFPDRTVVTCQCPLIHVVENIDDLESLAYKDDNTLLVLKQNLITFDGDEGMEVVDAMVGISFSGDSNFMSGISFRFFSPMNKYKYVWSPQHLPSHHASSTRQLTVRCVNPVNEKAYLHIVNTGAVVFQFSQEEKILAKVSGKLLHHVDLVCSVPEFNLTGPIQVAFSLNDENFVVIGLLRIHESLEIVSATPTISPYTGGHQLTINVLKNSSSILDFISKTKKERFSHWHWTELQVSSVCRKNIPLRSFKNAVCRIMEKIRKPTLVSVAKSIWKKKRTLRLSIYPVPRCNTKDAIVEVRDAKNGWLVASVKNEAGDSTFSFDATHFDNNVNIFIRLADNAYCKFKYLECPINSDLTTAVSAVLLTKPTRERIRVAVRQQKSASIKVILVNEDGNELDAKGFQEKTDDKGLQCFVIPYKDLQSSVVTGSYVFIAIENKNKDEATGAQVVIGDPSGDQKYFDCFVPRNAVWITSAINIENFEAVAVGAAFDAPLEARTVQQISLDVTKHLSNASIVKQGLWNPHGLLHVSLGLNVTSGVNSRKKKVLIDAALSFPKSPFDHIVQFHGTVPALPEPGKGKVSVLMDGITYTSSSTTINFYDTTNWKIRTIKPNCGLVNRTTAVQIQGSGFVETEKINVRFSTKDKSVIVPGKVKRLFTLNVSVQGTRKLQLTDISSSKPCIFLECNKKKFAMNAREHKLITQSHKFQFECEDITESLVIKVTDPCVGESQAAYVGSIHISISNLSLSEKYTKWHHVVEDGDEHRVSRGEIKLEYCKSPASYGTTYVVCNSPRFPTPCDMKLAISSGEGPFSEPCERIWHAYDLPRIERLRPEFLPLSVGGCLRISGNGFINSGSIYVRLHYKDECTTIVDIPANFVSKKEIKCEIPPDLPHFEVALTCSLDGFIFSNPNITSTLKLIGIRSLYPSTGPQSGKTLVRIEGFNLDKMVSSGISTPLVRFQWRVESRILHTVVVEASYCKTSHYFECLTPACKSGLEHIEVEVSIGLKGGKSGSFSSDHMKFTYYKAPSLRSIKSNLHGGHFVPGATSCQIETIGHLDHLAVGFPDATARYYINEEYYDGQITVKNDKTLLASIPRIPPQHMLSTNTTHENRTSYYFHTRYEGLVIVLLNATILSVKERTCTDFAAFLQNGGGKVYYRSKWVPKSANPVWNEVFHFPKYYRDRESKIELIIESRDPTSHNKFIGKVDIDTNLVSKGTSTARLCVPLGGSNSAVPDTRNRGKVEFGLYFNCRTSSEIIQVQPSDNAEAICPTEMTVEVALNGQNFCSKLPQHIHITQPPFITGVEPNLICAGGGTPVRIFGENFTHLSSLRVAFLWKVSCAEELYNPVTPLSISVVRGTFESVNVISCVAPSFTATNSDTDLIDLTILLSNNAIDFDSLMLPKVAGEECAWRGTNVIKAFPPPKILSIESADAMYTSVININGLGFFESPDAIARFSIESSAEEEDVPARFVSNTVMSCHTPDLHPGTRVSVSLSLNGIDFVTTDQVLTVYNAPVIRDTNPKWIHKGSSIQIQISGSNFFHSQVVKVLLSHSERQTQVDATTSCSLEDQVVILCEFPAVRKWGDNCKKSVLKDSISMDICLHGGKRYTNVPVRVNMYSNIPTVSQIHPTTGPCFGGLKLTIFGRNFLDTSEIQVRFRLLDTAENEEGGGSSITRKNMVERATHYSEEHIVPAEFVNTGSVTCVVPKFEDEGLVLVQASLNGFEYTKESTTSWYLVWKSWHSRPQVVPESMKIDGGGRLAWKKINELKKKRPFYAGSHAVVTKAPSPSMTSSRRRSTEIVIRMPNLSKTIVKKSTATTELQQKRLLNKLEEKSAHARYFTTMLKSISTKDNGDDSTRCLSLPLFEKLKTLLSDRRTKRPTIVMVNNLFMTLLKISPTQQSVTYNTLITIILEHIFPTSTEKDLLQVWSIVDCEQDGRVSPDNIMSRLGAFNPTQNLAVCPEPGPGTYNPNIDYVKPNVTFHSIAPERRKQILNESSSDSDDEEDIDDEKDINYEFLMTKSPRVVFNKRMYDNPGGVWCDPVVAPKSEALRTPTRPSAKMKKPSFRTK